MDDKESRGKDEIRESQKKLKNSKILIGRREVEGGIEIGDAVAISY